MFKKVQLFEPFFFSERFNSLSRTLKIQFSKSYSQNLWVIKKINSLSHIQKKNSISLSHVEKKGSISMSHVEKTRVQFLWVMLKKQGFNSVSHVILRVQFCESYWKKVSILQVISKNSLDHVVKKFNSLSHVTKKFNSLRHVKKEGTILWVTFFFSRFYSLSHVKKEGSILWVMLKVQLLESC